MGREHVGLVKRIGDRTRVVDVLHEHAKPMDLRAELPEEGSWVAVSDGAVRVLAAPGEGLANLYERVTRAGIDPFYSEAVLAETAAFPDALDLTGLADFRRLPLVPIDEVTSRDLDQALAIEVRGDGHVVWYAIADAAWFMPPGSALYEDALRRGATYYLPGLVIPMLPRRLSEDLISLNAGVDRRAMLFELTLDHQGVCIDTKIHRGVVHCRHKLDFNGVQRFLDGEQVDWDQDVQDSLRLLPEVGRRRMALAEARGVVQYRRVEVDVKVEGVGFVAMDGPRNDVEKYNEQISLLANIEGSNVLLAASEQEQVQPIYRVHAPPSEERLDDFEALTKQVAAQRGLPEATWVWRPAEVPLAIFLEKLPVGPLASALHRQAMVLNRPSHFASSPGAHFGVGAAIYGRFTAPMREVVGVFVHHETWEALAGKPLWPDHGDALRAQVVEVANRSRELQRQFNRDVNRLVLDALFAKDAAEGREREGVVMGLTSSRVHVRLHEPQVDVKIYVKHLERAFDTAVVLGEDGVLRGEGLEVALGDVVRVHVVEQDKRRDRWNLAISPARS